MPIAEFPALAREAEQRGYRTAWVGEASGAEAIVLSTLIATHTQTLKIANGVIPVQTRTPDRVRPGRGDARAPRPGPVRARPRAVERDHRRAVARAAVRAVHPADARGGPDHPDDRGGRAGELRGQVLPAQELPARDSRPVAGAADLPRRARPPDVRAGGRGGGRRPAQLDPAVRGARVGAPRGDRGQARRPEPVRRGRRGVRAHLRDRRARAGARDAGPGHHRLRHRERLRALLRGVRLRRGGRGRRTAPGRRAIARAR